MFWPWIAELFLITWRDIPGLGKIGPLKIAGAGNTVNGLPAPGDYLATFIIMAPLAAMADTRAKTVANLAGWAFVLGSLLSFIDPSDPLGKANASSSSSSGTGSGGTSAGA